MNKLNIPQKLHVGFQERGDTYTGKLAYVIWEDNKGKLRKETSWKGWTNESLGRPTFTNEPTEGFVLNKSGGGRRESWGWNPRNEFIRVYDPRGWEFEISLANLLFILVHCTSTKGKGLEGEFVYAWDGAALILMPTCCEEYKQSKDFTDLQALKVTKADMKEGQTYLHKDGEEVLYLGRQPIHIWDEYTSCYHYLRDVDTQCEKRHIFVKVSDIGDPEKLLYYQEKGFTKLAKILSTEIHENYSQELLKLQRSSLCVPVTGFGLTEISSDKKLKRDSLVVIYHKEQSYWELCAVTGLRNWYYADYTITNASNTLATAPTLRELTEEINYFILTGKIMPRHLIAKYSVDLPLKELGEEDKCYIIKGKTETGDLLDYKIPWHSS